MTRHLSRRRGRHAATHARRPWLRLLIALVLTATATAVVRAEVASVFYVPSASMEPTLHGCPGCADDRILVNRLSYAFSTPARGDIVVFTGTGDWAAVGQHERTLVKRVVAVAGDTVVCCDAEGRVVVNDEPVTEPYVVHNTAPRAFDPVRVPAGHLWVLGDNRDDSADSRDHGLVAVDDVVGKAVARVWPPSRLGALPGGPGALSTPPGR